MFTVNAHSSGLSWERRRKEGINILISFKPFCVKNLSWSWYVFVLYACYSEGDFGKSINFLDDPIKVCKPFSKNVSSCELVCPSFVISFLSLLDCLKSPRLGSALSKINYNKLIT